MYFHRHHGRRRVTAPGRPILGWSRSDAPWDPGGWCRMRRASDTENSSVTQPTRRRPEPKTSSAPGIPLTECPSLSELSLSEPGSLSGEDYSLLAAMCLSCLLLQNKLPQT